MHMGMNASKLATKNMSWFDTYEEAERRASEPGYSPVHDKAPAEFLHIVKKHPRLERVLLKKNATVTQRIADEIARRSTAQPKSTAVANVRRAKEKENYRKKLIQILNSPPRKK
jgi:hypothetical protein